MIRIDLLPDYVAKRRLTLLLMWVFGVLFATVTCGMLAVNYLVLAPQAVQKNQEATDAEAAKSKLDNLKAETASTLAEVQPIQDKLQFVNDVANYNRSWVALYDQLARYTDPKLVYASAAVSGASMAISAYTPSIEEVGRYLEKMYEEPDFTTVTIDHLPGYPESVINKYYLNGKLIAVGQLPGLNDARPGQAQGQGAGGQYGGGQPGQSPNGGGQPGQSPFGGAQPGQSPYGGGQGAPGQNGTLTASGLPTFGTVINPLTAQEIPNASLEGFIDQVVSPLATGDQVIRLRSVVRQQLLHKVVVKHQIRGFQISVSATLKKPFVAPVVPSSAGGAATTTASSGFGGGMMGPGGMSAGPGMSGPPGMAGPGMRPGASPMGQPGRP